MLYVGQVSRGGSGFSADLDGACGCQGEEGSQPVVGLSDGLWCGVGPETQVVHWLYVSIIRPPITFASLVWCPGSQTASTEKRLSRVQRLACSGVTGMMRTIPIGAMEALASCHWIW